MEGLRRFVEHVRKLKAKSDDEVDGFEEEFKKMKAATDKYKQSSAYAMDAGRNPVNKKKNRYKDVLPYDHSRVELPPTEGVDGSDYINASYMTGSDGEIAYVASQGPLPATVADFWRMIWCLRIEIVVMVCREVELGKHKCKRYWAEPGEALEYGGMTITEGAPSESISKDFVIRTLKADYDGDVLLVKQFHYNAWPDHGVPDTVEPVLKMIEMIRNVQPGNEPPLVVHCSAGCGRTGTVCAIDYAWNLIKSGTVPKDFNLYKMITEMRQQRMAIVQTKDQYVMVYKAVLQLVKQALSKSKKPKIQSVPGSSSSYVNVILPQKPTAYESTPPERAAAAAAATLASAESKPEPAPRKPRPPIKPKPIVQSTPQPQPPPVAAAAAAALTVGDGSVPDGDQGDDQLFVTDIDSVVIDNSTMERSVNAPPDEESEDNGDDESPPPPVPIRTEDSRVLVTPNRPGSLDPRDYENVVLPQQKEAYNRIDRSKPPVGADQQLMQGYDVLLGSSRAPPPPAAAATAPSTSYNTLSRPETVPPAPVECAYAVAWVPSGNDPVQVKGSGTSYNQLERKSGTDEPKTVVEKKPENQGGAYETINFRRDIASRPRSESPGSVKRSVPEVSAPTPATTLPRNVSGTSGGSGGGVGSNMAGKLKSIFKIGPKSKGKPKADAAPPSPAPILSPPPVDRDYENASHPLKALSVHKSPIYDLRATVGDDPMGFPNRIRKPGGPRDPPANWKMHA
ncbi:tyrosine-protein phosphatase non-receptor type 12-like [Oscarella lobularis]|uniref:tyrosine-protein phosphatase non-receptor type 12-like n=1 Tax=Oscarella lobularis TaxID=121494 RepID=UPI00331330BE